MDVSDQVLWFDVEKKNYTTAIIESILSLMLWFDVEKKNYTTKQTTTVIAIIRKICCWRNLGRI